MDVATQSFDAGAHAERIAAQGYTVIEEFLDAATVAAVREALAPYLGSHHGRNDFEGFRTERVYTLVARGRVFEDLTEEPRLMALLGRFLQPGFLLTASQAICIHPGETAQDIHVDDGFYRVPRPRPAISYTVIVAVDDFTAENGGTEIVPGSHLWTQADIEARRDELEGLVTPMVIPSGAAVVFAGTLLHRGGANRSARPRLAFTNQYCEPWARTQENFYLGIPREQLAAMSPRLKQLLGYDIWAPFMGQVTGSHPAKALEPGWVPPVVQQRRREA
ncbi:phytanoyl-CoA dioxygenase family protein [Phenylobacterium sp.]|uniref:phytanoyl-CoA dioxygenase family protein n=1 Tax=Phenylobacterium sp. TaxID=1871053 RepID=UPI002CE65D4A|nr:phytanoyl-CoA dioxygenase family protein [Phenylobacterium sp.]HVI34127.1 phytanoyl-CoA dioxygenase family protein [Phenylobacterium sp.]